MQMADFTTEQLQQLQTSTDGVLDTLILSLEGSEQMQAMAREIMLADEAVLSTFLKLASKQPETAMHVLVSSVSSLMNLQTSRAVKAELARRSARN